MPRLKILPLSAYARTETRISRSHTSKTSVSMQPNDGFGGRKGKWKEGYGQQDVVGLGTGNDDRGKHPLEDDLFEIENSCIANGIMERFDAAVPGDGRRGEEERGMPQTLTRDRRAKTKNLEWRLFGGRLTKKRGTGWTHQPRPLPAGGRSPPTPRRGRSQAHPGRPEEPASQPRRRSGQREPMERPAGICQPCMVR